MNWLSILLIAVFVVVLIIVLWVWMQSKNQPVPSGAVFTLDYSNVAPPLAGVFDGALVKPEINPNDLAIMYTDSFQVSDGDVVQLEETNTGVVVQSKLITFNNTTGVGDWSLLFNLRQQLSTDGFLNSLYTLSLVRNGSRLVSRVLSSNIVEIEWFRNDVRTLYPVLLQGPLVFLGDLLFVAMIRANGDRILEYLYYCTDDRNSMFTIHEASPNMDGPKTATLTALRQRFANKFVGLTNYEVEEITYWEPNPPTPPPSPIVIDTSKTYPATFRGVPPASDPYILDMSTALPTVKEGNTVQISRNGVVYYQVKNVKLEDVSNTELSNDYKFLFSGLYSLIDSNYLRTGDFLLQILTSTGEPAQSRLIPTNVTGIKLLPDKRLPTTAISESLIISDVAKITPRPNTGSNYDEEIWWCVDGNQKLLTNGTFTGTYKDIFAYYQAKYPDLNSILVYMCSYISPDVFFSISA